jgi:hypothetical protein
MLYTQVTALAGEKPARTRDLASHSCPTADNPKKFFQKGLLLRQLSEGDKMNTTGQADPRRIIAGNQLAYLYL